MSGAQQVSAALSQTGTNARAVLQVPDTESGLGDAPSPTLALHHLPAHGCMPDNPGMSEISSLRLDKWLWAARFYKTRSLAVEQISKNRVTVNGAAAKASREVRVGDTIALRQGHIPKTVKVLGLSAIRGPAPVAQQLYEETADSIAERARLAELHRLAPEPASAIALQHDGRPTKRDRRAIERTRHQWNDRWSASWNGD